MHNIQEAATDKELVFDEETTNVQAYKHVSRGNATEAIAKAKHVISHHFETPWTEHAFLEPECAVAYIDDDGDVFLYTTDQSSHTTLHECTTGARRQEMQGAERPCRRRLRRQGGYVRAASRGHAGRA